MDEEIKLRIKEGQKRKKYKIIISVVLLILLLIVSFFIDKSVGWDKIFKLSHISDINPEIENYKLQIHFIDVGKADSILIKSDSGNVLIDAGDTDVRPKVKRYLKHQNISTLNGVIITHPDKDHFGQAEDVINEFAVEKFIYYPVPKDLVPQSEEYTNMISALNEKSIYQEAVKAGDTLSFGEINLKVLAPTKSDNKEVNNNSLILKLEYGQDSFIFMGDAEEAEEKLMIDSKTDVKAELIKIGHHGSKTSTSDLLLDTVKPTYAVICTGEDRSNLPKQAIIEKLENRNIKIYRTDTDGTVAVGTNGDGINIFTETLHN